MSDSGPVGFRVASDKPFLIGLGVLGGSYLLIIVAMVLADLVFLNYADQPLLGNEMVKQGRHVDSGVTVATEKGRRYFFRAGKNETGLRSSGGAIFGTGLFTATDGEVTLLAVESGRPVTASLRPEVRLSGIAVTNNVATLTTDEPHGLLWGEFIRVSDADAAGWNGVREITDTTLHQISFALDSDGAQAGRLPLETQSAGAGAAESGHPFFHQAEPDQLHPHDVVFTLGCGANWLRDESVPVSRQGGD